MDKEFYIEELNRVQMKKSIHNMALKTLFMEGERDLSVYKLKMYDEIIKQIYLCNCDIEYNEGKIKDFVGGDECE